MCLSNWNYNSSAAANSAGVINSLASIESQLELYLVIQASDIITARSSEQNTCSVSVFEEFEVVCKK